MAKFSDPLEGAVFYEDEKVYACLAFGPKTEGHTIVAWKADIGDLNDLGPRGLWSPYVGRAYGA